MKIVLKAVLALCVICACSSDSEDELYEGSNCDTTLVSFQSDILPIIKTNCSSCHGGVTPSAGLLLENYDQISSSSKNNTSGGMINRIEREESDPRLMPMGYKLPTCEIDQIKAWVNQGSLDN